MSFKVTPNADGTVVLSNGDTGEDLVTFDVQGQMTVPNGLEGLEDIGSGSLSTEDFLHVQDQKPSGTSGGTFTANTWFTRDLNTVVTNTIEGTSLASNSVNLPAGTYYAEGLCPAYAVNHHKARLTNGSSTLIWGLLDYANGTYFGYGYSIVKGLLTLTENTTVFLEHVCQYTQSSSGLGLGIGSYSTVPYETYTDLKIWKVG